MDTHHAVEGETAQKQVAGQRDENTVSKALVSLWTAEEGQEGAKSSVSRVASRAISTACCRISREVRLKLRERGGSRRNIKYIRRQYIFLSAL